MKTEQYQVVRLSKSVIGDAEKAAVDQILSIGFLGTGPETKAFEEELKDYIGGQTNVVCTNTGTSALQLAVQACNIGPGDEVLVPTLTYVASFQAIASTGAKPVACDVQLRNGLLDLEDCSKRVSARTKAIMPVHYTGFMGDLNAVYTFAKKHNLRVIEDAAHAFGCTYNGKKIGSFGDVVCFSFDGIKNITSGEGGAVVSSDSEVIQKIQDLRLLGVEKDTLNRYQRQRSWEFDVKEQGWRYHMSDIMAAIGRVQLQRFKDEFEFSRKTLYKHYRSKLENVAGICFLETNMDTVCHHIMVVRILNGKRDHIRKEFSKLNVQTGIHYKPNHLLSYFKQENPFPVADRLYNELMSLPLHPELNTEDVGFICDNLIKFLVE